MTGPRRDLLSAGEAESDALLGRFLEYVAGQGLELYPAQEERFSGASLAAARHTGVNRARESMG